MRRFPIHLLGSLLSMIVMGCSAGSETDGKKTRPRAEPGPENPVVFNVDYSRPLPLLTILATPAEGARLRAMYASFYTEMGPPRKGVTLSLRFDKKGSLGIPWNFYLPHFAPPYPVRLMGILPDGTKEVIHQESF